MWIFGGRVKTKKGGIFDSEGTGVMYRNDLHCYDPTTNEWYRYEPRGIGPGGRALHTATVVGRKIYIFGGANSTGHRNDTSGFCDLYELDIDTMCWTECETQNTPPSPRYGHSATYIGDNKILYFGGKGYQVLRDIHILDVKTMEWKQFAYAGNPLSPRWGHSATLHDHRVVIYGGRADHGYYNSLETIDTTNELIEVQPEEQAKEKLKRKQEEKNRTREAIGNLQNSVSELQSMIGQLGEQLVTQKKSITEMRGAAVALRQENETLKQQVALLRFEDTSSPPSTLTSPPSFTSPPMVTSPTPPRSKTPSGSVSGTLGGFGPPLSFGTSGSVGPSSVGGLTVGAPAGTPSFTPFVFGGGMSPLVPSPFTFGNSIYSEYLSPPAGVSLSSDTDAKEEEDQSVLTY